MFHAAADHAIMDDRRLAHNGVSMTLMTLRHDHLIDNVIADPDCRGMMLRSSPCCSQYTVYRVTAVSVRMSWLLLALRSFSTKVLRQQVSYPGISLRRNLYDLLFTVVGAEPVAVLCSAAYLDRSVMHWSFFVRTVLLSVSHS